MVKNHTKPLKKITGTKSAKKIKPLIRIKKQNKLNNPKIRSHLLRIFNFYLLTQKKQTRFSNKELTFFHHSHYLFTFSE